jgi:hypothetical protein
MVLIPGGPVRSAILISSSGSGADALGLLAFTDSTGRYEVSVPPGEYSIEARVGSRRSATVYYGSARPVWSRRDADTVRVAHEDVRADFILGALSVAIAVPGARESTEYDACLCELQDSGVEKQASQGGITAVDEILTVGWPAVPPGAYLVSIEPSAGQTIYPPGTRAWSEAETIRVASGEVTETAATFAPPAILVGEVRGSWQHMHSRDRPRVFVFNNDSLQVARVRLDGDTEYELPLFLPETIRLMVSIDYMKRWIGGDTFAEATRFEPVSGEILDVGTHVESGMLCYFSGPDYELDHHALCTVHDGQGDSIFRRWTGASNPFLISNLSPGTYYLRVENDMWDQRWVPQWFDRADSLSNATPIEVPDGGAVVEIEVQFTRGGKIQGRVVTASGEPYGGAAVRISRREDVSHTYRWTWTSALTGEFSAEILADGEYIVGVIAEYYSTYWYPGTWAWQLAEVVSIEDAETVTGIDWTVPESSSRPDAR